MFDGDILNIIGIINEELKYIFRKFNPVERMIMARDTGLLNEYFSITKGQLIDLLYFCIIENGAEDLPVDKNREKYLKKQAEMEVEAG